MSKRTWTLCALLGVGLAWRAPAQDLSRLNFNIGGGPSTPLNPTGQFAGVSGNFVSGIGYNIDKKKYTTFSTFGWEAAAYLREAQYGRAAAYILANNVIGIALVVVGYALSRLHR